MIKTKVGGFSGVQQFCFVNSRMNFFWLPQHTNYIKVEVAPYLFLAKSALEHKRETLPPEARLVRREEIPL